jgi:dipeptidyl aminopeptidase/acylaminoacyl peptidase
MVKKIKSELILCMIGIFSVLFASCVFNRHYYNDPAFEYVGFPEANNLVWPLFEPDSILLSTTDEYSHSKIIKVDLSSGETQTVIEVANGTLEIETISPDGNQIIFHTEEGTEGFEMGGLWIMQLDTGQVKFFRNGDHAAWSPDNVSVLVTKVESSSNDVTEKLVVLNLVNVEGDENNIYKFDKMDDVYRPSWAPDGQLVAVSMSYDNTRRINIFEIDIRTWEIIHITNGDVDLSPSWSPEGDVIAYRSSTYYDIDETGFNLPELFLVNADGSCDKGVGGIDSIQFPQWSPDGQNLIFIGPDGVYLINIGKIVLSYMSGCGTR